MSNNEASTGDVTYLVIESLSFSKKGSTLKEILNDVPFSKASIAGSLAILNAIGFVDKKNSANGVPEQTHYTLITPITPYQIIKVIELGVDLRDLARLLSIPEKQKQAALNLATQADKLKELDDELKAKRMAERAKPVEALPRNMVVETLEQIALATQQSMEQCKKQHGKNSEEFKALQEAYDQALKAQKEYQLELAKAGSHSGF